MRLIADLHIHSRFSRGCSKDITLKNLERYSRMKGVDMLGTGDFTHPVWFSELRKELTEEDGILKSGTGFSFMLQVEISNIYKQGGKVRRIHNIILAPGFETAGQINDWLLKKGRLDYDGRPIFGFDCMELVDGLFSISRDIAVIPAHVWTPHFGLFGSLSGFDSLEECFGDRSKNIFAVETGLSSTPSMNWRVEDLDGISLVSFSDAHSHYPWRLGREACIFDIERPTYHRIVEAIRERDRKAFTGTIEFFPEEGKYHYDGHRDCGVCLKPEESEKLNGICPKCKRKMTLGVLNRIEELASREEGFRHEGSLYFKSLIPLSEIIAHAKGCQPFSKKAWETYSQLIKSFGTEYRVLLDADLESLKNAADGHVAKAITDVREGRVSFRPGYDGLYGLPDIRRKEALPQKRQKADKVQRSISDF
ncbi:MAG: DNA helicase UvrD [Candidatus Aenigmarchaeota archaeon]|nr:DNA helicase UvrD [Candidatus Aenigmarchaeota archaeon]